ncbi:hypothetical protein SAMN05880556_101718 [Azospirillum sp. RU38E]|nr:hypothetical protein SAMN05880556_101718 [Azospirillum sp. RU38E]SNS10959.1 hypothetical protein SAMN05880591_101718 [Azospirillum sp. RU37A]
MVNGPYNPYASSGRAMDQAQFDAGLRTHMLRVYNYMCLALAITGVTAFVGSQIPALVQLIHGTPLKWVVMLAPLAFIFFGFRPDRMSASALRTSLMLFSVLMGLSMMSIFLVFTGQSIARVFFITAAMFAGTSLWGYTTKADLSKMGSFMMMGLIGIVIAGLVNIFVGSSALQFAISIIGVIVFTGLTAWDTQAIKEGYASSYGDEANSRMAVMGALSLYLNFINLFQMLLSLMGQRND